MSGATLNEQLEAGLRRFARDPKYVRRTEAGLQVSKILEWFAADFIAWFPEDRLGPSAEPTVVDYLLPHLPADTAAFVHSHGDPQVSYDPYDWRLNDQGIQDGSTPTGG